MKRSVRAKETEAKLDTETVATPANLIMAGCELDSLTDGPGTGRYGTSASSQGRERRKDGTVGGAGEEEDRKSVNGSC